MLLVRGPLSAHNAAGTRSGARRSEGRRRQVHRDVRELCRRRHVAYLGWDVSVLGAQNPGTMLGDRVHMNSDSHARLASDLAAALIEAWQRVHGPPTRGTAGSAGAAEAKRG